MAAHLGRPLPERFRLGFYPLGYFTLTLPVVGSGLGLAVIAWAYFWRRRTFGGGVVAAWNTFAQVSKMMRALHEVPGSLSGSVGALSGGNGDDDDSSLLSLIVRFLIAVFLLGGILITRHIVLSTARKHYDGIRSALRQARQP